MDNGRVRFEVLRKRNPRILRSCGTATKEQESPTNPQVAQPDETRRESRAEIKQRFRYGDETEERDPLSWIDLKASHKI